MKIIIISGRSGSGKTVALRVLEDLGYYCVDNIPVNLLPALAHSLNDRYETVAVSVDVRNFPEEADELSDILDYLPTSVTLSVLYLDAEEDILIQRFSETRRLHPLSKQSMSLEKAIKQEKVLLEPLAGRADLYIDTTQLTVHQLAETVKERILGKKSNDLVIIFQSFGFKYGIPKDADYVFDVRFLPNPHWEPDLKPLTGLDQPVIDYLSTQPLVTKLVWQVNSFLSTWLPHLERNNRSYLTVAIGCTGGQHRSVFIAETLANIYRKLKSDVQIQHRELSRHETPSE
ncbi:RNase adapter RapZ [Flocculibacter collagenilyticus]|uniref:RNase adapter RapZ n=1 Tax=Flocculibacter collagenilyticus TaxID=2744479 RepID=UPI0018F7CD7D|nr:RNase adapter RapZ [Flocculibacter collagenilyticus]